LALHIATLLAHSSQANSAFCLAKGGFKAEAWREQGDFKQTNTRGGDSLYLMSDFG